jgi:hypothetical protein
MRSKKKKDANKDREELKKTTKPVGSGAHAEAALRSTE